MATDLDNSKKINWTDKVDEILSLQRNYKSIEVNLEDKRAIRLFMKVVEVHGIHIKLLDLYHGHFMDEQYLIDILRNVPQLETMICSLISCSKIICHDQGENKQIAMAKLKNLQLNYCSWSLLDFLIGPVKSLEVIGGQMNDVKPLLKFLMRSKIESLVLDGTSFQKIFSSKISKILPLKLKKFTFVTSKLNKKLEENFIAFLEKQDLLLELNVENFITPSIYLAIFTKLKVLRKFKFDANSLPLKKSFYDEIKPITSIKELEIDYQFPGEIAAQGLLGNCPSLEILKVTNDKIITTKEMLEFVNINNRNLKHLSVNNIMIQI